MEKQFRIKKSNDIAKIVKLKNRVYCQYFTLYYEVNSLKTKIAFSVSKKYGKAHERVYAKRRMREIFRPYINKDDIYINAVMVIKPEFKDASFTELESGMAYCYKLILLKNRKDKNNEK